MFRSSIIDIYWYHVGQADSLRADSIGPLCRWAAVEGRPIDNRPQAASPPHMLPSGVQDTPAVRGGQDADAAVHAAHLDAGASAANPSAERSPVLMAIRRGHSEIARDPAVYGADVELGVTPIGYGQRDTSVDGVQGNQRRSMKLFEAGLHAAIHRGKLRFTLQIPRDHRAVHRRHFDIAHYAGDIDATVDSLHGKQTRS